MRELEVSQTSQAKQPLQGISQNIHLLHLTHVSRFKVRHSSVHVLVTETDLLCFALEPTSYPRPFWEDYSSSQVTYIGRLYILLLIAKRLCVCGT